MQLGSVGAVIPLPQLVQGRAMLGDQENLTYGSKGRRLAYYLFIFYVKFSAV